MLSAVQRRCLEYTRDALVSIRSLLDEVSTISTAYTIPSEGPGQPTLFISQEQLIFLVESNFTVPKIANILGVSVRTIGLEDEVTIVQSVCLQMVVLNTLAELDQF